VPSPQVEDAGAERGLVLVGVRDRLAKVAQIARGLLLRRDRGRRFGGFLRGRTERAERDGQQHATGDHRPAECVHPRPRAPREFEAGTRRGCVRERLLAEVVEVVVGAGDARGGVRDRRLRTRPQGE
jgi:hypothetical protein